VLPAFTDVGNRTPALGMMSKGNANAFELLLKSSKKNVRIGSNLFEIVISTPLLIANLICHYNASENVSARKLNLFVNSFR
jgi:hypothetical protein